MSGTKLRISTANRSAVFRFEEEQVADWHFSQLVTMLMSYLDEEPENEDAEAQEDSDLSPEQENKESSNHELLSEKCQEMVNNERTTEVKGFVYMKCPNCGSIHGANLKDWSTHYRCKECGGLIAFQNLRSLYVDCECGKKFYYKTNLKVPMFDIPCLACGNPVAVYYNEKKESYQTIGVRR